MRKKHDLYCEFKKFLLTNKYTQPAGSDAFLSVATNTPQTIAVGEKIIWNTILADRNVYLKPGTGDIYIQRTGDYDIFNDVITDRPSQFTVFVNNVPLLDTASGRDSGGNRDLLRNILHLKKGDVLSIRNWKSVLGTVTTTQNAGGNFVNANSL